MKPHDITGKQFAWYAVVSGTGLGMWLVPGEPLFYMSFLLLAFAPHIIMSKAERSRPVVAKDSLLIGAGLGITFTLIFASDRWVSEETMALILHGMRHPLFVIPVWAFVVGWAYYDWKRSRRAPNQGG